MKITVIQNFIFARPTLPSKPFAQSSYALATSQLKPARTVVASTASTHILMYDAKAAANTDLTKLRKVCTKHRRSTLFPRLCSRSFFSSGTKRSSSKGTFFICEGTIQIGYGLMRSELLLKEARLCMRVHNLPVRVYGLIMQGTKLRSVYQ